MPNVVALKKMSSHKSSETIRTCGLVGIAVAQSGRQWGWLLLDELWGPVLRAFRVEDS